MIQIFSVYLTDTHSKSNLLRLLLHEHPQTATSSEMYSETLQVTTDGQKHEE